MSKSQKTRLLISVAVSSVMCFSVLNSAVYALEYTTNNDGAFMTVGEKAKGAYSPVKIELAARKPTMYPAPDAPKPEAPKK